MGQINLQRERGLAIIQMSGAMAKGPFLLHHTGQESKGMS